MYLNKKAYSSRQKQDSNHVEDKFKYPKKETPVWFSFTLKHNQRKKNVKVKKPAVKSCPNLSQSFSAF